jgi:hypothetical protein
MANIKPGDRLSVKISAKQLPEVRRELVRLGIGPHAVVYATYVDSAGVSVYIKRTPRPDLHAFISNGGFENWMSFFDAGTLAGDGPNQAYAGTRHSTVKFPQGCV